MTAAFPKTLDEAGRQRIHEAALWLLDNVGCSILDPKAVALLGAHGARIDGHLVKFGEDVVERALATVPSGYTTAGRGPESELRVALDAPPVLASASGPPFVLHDGEQRPGTLADLRVAIALADASSNIDVLGNSVEPTDVPEDRRARVCAHAHATGSSKPFRFAVGASRELQVAIDVMQILHGSDWHEQPRLWSIVNSTSPLQFSADAAQAILRLARLGQPVCVAVCAMGGTTAPLTLAGLLATQHAELLCGLALTQLARPGCPFLYGGTSSISSMQTGALMMGTPEYWTLMGATVQLGHFLGLPVRAGGSVTDAHVPDAQAGIESALGIHTVLSHNVQYVLHAAGILSSFNCFSPVKFVIDDEVLTALRIAAQPVAIHEESLAMDVLAAIGPGGSALGQPHTRRHARDAARSSIMNRAPFQTWRALGGRDLAETAAQRVDDVLDAYAAPEDLDPVVRRQLDAYCLE